jgi:hypothetical protein
MDNRLPAIEDYKTALKLDVYCNEAFELLIKHEMLTPEEGICCLLLLLLLLLLLCYIKI